MHVGNDIKEYYWWTEHQRSIYHRECELNIHTNTKIISVIKNFVEILAIAGQGDPANRDGP